MSKTPPGMHSSELFKAMKAEQDLKVDDRLTALLKTYQLFMLVMTSTFQKN